ncbi:MAG TPA: hypothetical protein VN442_06605 [Bryobacteraceae bacterium]|nr:hypothetical protein [Bryobacteraceae bacterium]
MTPLSRAILSLALGGLAAFGQTVVSARSGMIHLSEGRVFLADEAIQSKFGQFPEVKENQVLHTEAGRAEVILTPGVFLRLAENSSFRMVTNRLIDTRLEFLSGSAVIEAGDILRDNAVTVVHHGASIQLVKRGLYRFDGEPAAVRVFDGELLVTAGDRRIEVKEGRMLSLGSDLAVAKFDQDETDALDRWSRRRAEYVAMANVSAANSIRRSGNTWASNGWAWNPYFGMFTFVPMSGSYYSPYGYRYWSPGAVYALYQPRMIYASPAGGGYNAPYGYRTMTPTASGHSGVMATAPSVSAPASHAPTTSAGSAASAPVSRGESSGGGARR